MRGTLNRADKTARYVTAGIAQARISGVIVPGIRESPDDDVSLAAALIGDPVKRAILRDLLRRERATVGDLGARLRSRFGIGRSAASSHITQLRMGKLIRRDRGALIVTDPHQLQVVLVELVRLVRNQNAQSARTIQAEFIELQDSAVPDWDPAAASTDATGPPTPTPITHDGFIQRDTSLNARSRPPTGAPVDTAKWVWVASTSFGPQLIAPSQPAHYYPHDPHLVIINATWIPFVMLLEDRTGDRHAYQQAYECLQTIVESQIGQILTSIRPTNKSEAAINEALHDGVRKRWPRIEAQLRDTLALLRSVDH